MEVQRLEQIGNRLRELEHQRSEAISRLVHEVGQQHDEQAKHLYGRLSEVSHGMIELINEQRELAERAVGNLHLPGQPGHWSADTPPIGRAT